MLKDKILRAKQVKEAVGYSIPSIYRLAKQGLFPKPLKLGKHASGWIESEVNDWLEKKIVARDEEVTNV